VGQQDPLDFDVGFEGGRQQLIHFVARVDEHRFPRALAPHDEAVLVERRHGTHLENHGRM
jgi:hypothetical protein